MLGKKMDSPRQHLRSSQSRRKVRFRNNNIDDHSTYRQSSNVYRKNNFDEENFLEKGLDLSLFEGRVDQDLICAICRRVFVKPEVSYCQHVFCSGCLHSSIKEECPTCSIPLDKTPANQPPVHLRVKLLNLVIHCDHKCGEVLPLGKLPRHVSDECPNTPMPCPHSKKGGSGGCQIKVKRCQLQDHVQECDWRPVQCEACGERTVFRDLVLHQKKSRCVENRIRNQLVKAIKSTNKEALKHRKTLDHQRVKLESHQRRNEIDHVRRLQSMKTLTRQGSWHPHHQQYHSHNGDTSLSSSSFNDYSNSSSKNSCYSNNAYNDNNSQHRQRCVTPRLAPIKSIHQSNESHDKTIATTSNNDSRSSRPSSQQLKERKALPQASASNTSVIHSSNTATVPSNSQSNNFFFTSVEVHDEDGEKANGVCSVPPSRETGHGYQPDIPFTCKKCNKRVRDSCNKPNSCRWHAGPIIELFGGTCYTCGRLDYQQGCMTGYHEI